MANEQAYFAKIAADNKATRPGLAKCPPIDFQSVDFKPSDEIAPAVIQKSYEELKKDYWDEIKTLRAYYSPFLRDLVPKARKTRKTQVLSEFDFRFETPEDNRNFENAQKGRGEWEHVKLPHYHGPVGRWTAFYRSEFKYFASADKRVWLNFLGADYIANVYLNGRYVGSHEGMFAPFKFEVTKLLRRGKNVLLVELKNDLPTTGIEGDRIDGDKIYAATGLGWDDPQTGWHHCPPGGGIYNKVFLEETPDYFINDVFMRPDIDCGTAQAWVQVFNATDENYSDRGKSGGFTLGVKIYARNFSGTAKKEVLFENIPYTGPGANDYRYEVPMGKFKTWELDRPYLYTARISLYSCDGELLDQYDKPFGMRKFSMETDCEGDKGELFFNNKKIRLRGANDMGHMQLAVCDEDWELLITDILIAKVANMNYYRFTQRPVQDEIYLYCDMLGMLNQTDLPLFGTFRRGQFYEGIRQTGEMERLVRSHPSCIMVTYINEPFPIERDGKCHRHLGRPELERWFECCDRAIKQENPDRVIKRVEGDYDPPTNEGLSDFHCYNMWYTNHALPIGRIYKNWLPAVRIGWKTGCGEYGTEGLDNYDVMTSRYPKEWLPKPGEQWLPDKIVFAQSNTMHGDWYEEQEGILNWISESQRHQAFAAKLMTDAFRRRSDKIVSTALHLLIDAWPAGWMKVLVGVDRQPKPGFFEFKNSLVPLRLNLRSDRWTAYGGETIPLECWLLNDTQEDHMNLRMVVTMRNGDQAIGSWELTSDIEAVSPKCAGIVKAMLPNVTAKIDIHFDAALYDGEKPIHNERFTVRTYPKQEAHGKAVCIGQNALTVAKSLGFETEAASYLPDHGETVLISDNKCDLSRTEKLAKSGCKIVILPPDSGTAGYQLGKKSVGYDYIYGVYDAIDGAMPFDHEDGVAFVARDPENPLTAEFGPQDFAYLYNSKKDFIDTAAVNYIKTDGFVIKPIVFTYAKAGFFEKTAGHKKKLPVAAELADNLFAVSMSIDGRTGYNPVLDKLIINLCK
ncbi:MAG TPA: glycoside hydrolase family 2 TIM barrel-domain containing protein [Oscillospiraceae bacterium]|nr:glycoside hydrolase family 2 TIM barrel-domain containing protein [Oscillospiraceae bacterium]HPF55208.1 glycoside hydrolase family 2 TIM barrel-domain containing protein [Clostridiales bacterium]HPR76856.1 glycoside hydrolase family 2 TIM barrel-domain containing protein [Oscillospiraceae bacterium]